MRVRLEGHVGVYPNDEAVRRGVSETEQTGGERSVEEDLPRVEDHRRAGLLLEDGQLTGHRHVEGPHTDVLLPEDQRGADPHITRVVNLQPAVKRHRLLHGEDGPGDDGDRRRPSYQQLRVGRVGNVEPRRSGHVEAGREVAEGGDLEVSRHPDDEVGLASQVERADVAARFKQPRNRSCQRGENRYINII